MRNHDGAVPIVPVRKEDSLAIRRESRRCVRSRSPIHFTRENLGHGRAGSCGQTAAHDDNCKQSADLALKHQYPPSGSYLRFSELDARASARLSRTFVELWKETSSVEAKRFHSQRTKQSVVSEITIWTKSPSRRPMPHVRVAPPMAPRRALVGRPGRPAQFTAHFFDDNQTLAVRARQSLMFVVFEAVPLAIRPLLVNKSCSLWSFLRSARSASRLRSR